MFEKAKSNFDFVMNSLDDFKLWSFVNYLSGVDELSVTGCGICRWYERIGDPSGSSKSETCPELSVDTSKSLWHCHDTGKRLWNILEVFLCFYIGKALCWVYLSAIYLHLIWPVYSVWWLIVILVVVYLYLNGIETTLLITRAVNWCSGTRCRAVL